MHLSEQIFDMKMKEKEYQERVKHLETMLFNLLRLQKSRDKFDKTVELKREIKG